MERNLRKKGYEAKATSFTVQTPLMTVSYTHLVQDYLRFYQSGIG